MKNETTMTQASISLTSDEVAQKTLEYVRSVVGKIDRVITTGLLYDEHLSTLDKVLASEDFELMTGCSSESFELFIESGWINRRSLNHRVGMMYFYLKNHFGPYL